VVHVLLTSAAMKSPTAFALGLALTALSGACTSSETTSSTSLTQEPGNCGSLETHIFGAHHSPDGRMTVHIDRVGTHAIVVTAHDKTTWKITAAPGAEIEAIYAVGVHEQTIVGPAGVTAVSESGDDGGPSACAYGWPDSGPGCNTKNLIDLVEHRVHEVTSFHGCETATSWVLGGNMLVTGNCNVFEGSAQKDMVKGCDGEDSCGGPIFL
jgi:hypothetical protein